MISTPTQRVLAAALGFRSPPLRLIDGGLTIRDRLVARMASDLVAGGAYADEFDAITYLRFKGYSPQNVFLLVADARQMALQTVVTEAMSAP